MTPFRSSRGGGSQYTDIDVELITIVVTFCGGADGPKNNNTEHMIKQTHTSAKLNVSYQGFELFNLKLLQ